MIGLIRAEALKLRTTRTSTALSLGVVVVIALAVGAAAGATHFAAGDHPARDALAPAGLVQTAALLLGVLAISGEFRYGTIAPSLLITPSRTRLLAAKLIAVAARSVILGALAFGLAAKVALPILAHRGVPSMVQAGDVVCIVAGGAIATALFAVFGLGLGALLRNQVAAIVAALGLLYVAEPLLTLIPGVAHAVQRFGLGGISSAVSRTTGFGTPGHALGWLPAVGVLGGYTAAVAALGATALNRRDVTP